MYRTRCFCVSLILSMPAWHHILYMKLKTPPALLPSFTPQVHHHSFLRTAFLPLLFWSTPLHSLRQYATSRTFEHKCSYHPENDPLQHRTTSCCRATQWPIHQPFLRFSAFRPPSIPCGCQRKDHVAHAFAVVAGFPSRPSFAKKWWVTCNRSFLLFHHTFLTGTSVLFHPPRLSALNHLGNWTWCSR